MLLSPGGFDDYIAVAGTASAEALLSTDDA